MIISSIYFKCVSKMANMSEGQEATIVAIGTTATALSAYVASQPIPDEIKVPVCIITGAIGVALLTFWKTKVNKPEVPPT